MKLIKILALMLVGVSAFISCSDDKSSINSASDVTVTMETAEVSFMESKGIVRVPVRVTGDANGYVTVTCEVEEYGDNPAFDDAHYYLTSPTITIADAKNGGDGTGYFELSLYDDKDINDPRTFKITLVDAQGATIGSPASTIVTLEDNDDKPYDRLDGTWYAEYDNNGVTAYKEVQLRAHAPGEYGYGGSYDLIGLFGANTDDKDAGGMPILVFFNYNEASKEGDISIDLGQQIGKTTDAAGETKDVTLMCVTTQGTVQGTGSVVMTWNEDCTVLGVTQTPTGDDSVALAPLYIYDNKYYLADNIMEGFSGLYRTRP